MPLLVKASLLTVSDPFTDAEPWFANKRFSGTGTNSGLQEIFAREIQVDLMNKK